MPGLHVVTYPNTIDGLVIEIYPEDTQVAILAPGRLAPRGTRKLLARDPRDARDPRCGVRSGTADADVSLALNPSP